MSTNTFLLSLKKYKLPLHVSDDSTATIRFHSSKEVTQELKDFHSGDALLRLHTNFVMDSAEPSLTDRSNTSRTMEASANTHLNKKTSDKFVDKIMHNYLAEEPLSVKRRIKCTSMDRRSLNELATSYKVEVTIKDMKRICDMNLNILLEDLKKVYVQKKSFLQPFCMNIGRLVTMFIFSSLSSLRSKKGKYILEKLDELENIIYNHLNIRESPKISPALSPIHSSGHDKSIYNFNELAMRAYNPFNTASAIGNTPRIRRKHPDSFGHIPDPSDKQTYQEVLKLVAKVKYTIAQLGHLMHYDRIANPTLAPIKNIGQIQQEQISSLTQQKSQVSMDLDEERQSEIFMGEDVPQTKNVQEYFYIMQKAIDDFDENIITKKVESLRRFCVWKAKKWNQREKIEKKYQKMTCKICESSVKTEKFKSHIELCRKKAELNKRLKELDNKINDSIFYAFMEAKTLQKTLVVESKKYSKLKARATALQNQQNSVFDPSTPMVQANGVKGGKSLEATPDIRSKNLRKSPKKELIRRHSMQIDNKMLFKKFIPENISGKESPISPTKISDAKCSDDSQTLHKLNSESSESSFVMCIEDKERSIPSPPATQARKQIDVYKEPVGESKPVNINRTQNRRLSVLTKAFQKLHLEEAEDLKDNFSPRGEGEPKGNALDDNHPLSARLASKNGSDNSPSASDSSYGDSQNSDRSVTYTTSPEGKPLTPVYKKSKFHPRNVNAEDNADDESDNGKFFSRPVEHRDSAGKRSSQEEETGFGLLRRTKTGMDSNPSPEASLNKSFAEDGQAAHSISQLKQLKEGMDKKKLQIELYETVQTKAKIVVNQVLYTKELDMIKDEITTAISDLLSEVKNKKIKEFAQNLLDILLERISCGKNIEDTKKKIDQLEGKLPDEPMKSKTHERRPSFMRGNSLIFSPAKQPKNLVNSKKRFTEELSSQRFSFLNKSLCLASNRTASTPLKVGVEVATNPKDFTRLNTFGDDDRILQDLDQGQDTFTVHNIEDQPNFANEIPDIDAILNEPEDKGMSLQEENDTGIRESKDAILSLWNASISEMQDSRKQEESEAFDCTESPMGKLTQDYLKDSLPSSIAISQGVYNKVDSALINPSISILEVSPRKKSLEPPSPAQALKTPDFTSEDNKRFLFAKKEEHDSPITPTFDRGIVSKLKASTAPPLDFSDLPTTIQKQSGIDNMPSITKALSSNDKPTIVFNHTRTESKDKTLNFKRLDKNGTVIGPGSRPMSPTHEPDNGNRSSLKNMLGTSKLFQMLEKKEDYDMNRLPSLCPTPIGSLTKIDPGSECGDDDNFFTSRKSSKLLGEDDDDGEIIHEEFKENLESLSILESPMYDREYFSDSEAQDQRKTVFKAPPTIGIKDFEPLKIISKGAFGRVWLVRKKATKDLYAMKVINLAEKAMKNTELDNLKKENSVFNLAQEDYVVRAVFTFTHETCICFVMEYMIGGDLGDFLFNYYALDEDVARFYIAEIIMAVEYLHSLGIVHRDLKPDNILLDKNGHAKLTDFGLSETGLSEKIKSKGSPEQKSPALFRERLEALKRFYAVDHGVGDQVNLKVKGKLVGKRHESREYTSEDEKDVKASDSGDKLKRKGHRLVGTPDYMAPEIISHISITSYSSDWWSVGVILFEFLVGIAPFNDESPELIYDNILNLRIPWDQIKIGEGEDCLSHNAVDLIKKLLNPDQTARLGTNGAQEIKEHPFFDGLDWETHRKHPAPITFDEIQDTDTQNFARMHDKISEKEKEDPFVLIPKSKDTKSNLQAAIQFIESAQDNFQRVNIPALYSATLQLAEETIKKKEGELKQIHDKNGVQKFNDVFEMPE